MANKDRLEYLSPNVFIDGPGDALCRFIAAELKKIPQMVKLFSGGIESYERDDFNYTMLPAIRIFNNRLVKEHESHYITGDVQADIIFPPSIRREDAQIFQDIVSSALMQFFRRPLTLSALREVVPGLNELGKVFTVDKSLGMVVQQNICPITQITLNLRIDLKEWDEYLEREGRTKDQPFDVTLEELDRIGTIIQGLNDDESVNVEVDIDQNIGGD